MSTTITIRIPTSVKRDLERICKDHDLQMSALVRESLDRIMAIYRFEKNRKDVKRYAEKAGYLTDEDVFKLRS